jgi:TonB family protein
MFFDLGMEITKERIIGIAGSTVFCLLTGLLLFNIYLRTQVETDEEGVLVVFGTISEARNEPAVSQSASHSIPQNLTETQSQPASNQSQPQQPAAPSQPSAGNNQPVITADEQTAALDEARAKRLEKERLDAERAKQQREQAAKAEKLQAQKDSIAKAKAEAERLQAQRNAAAKAEAEKLQAQREAAAKAEAERKAREAINSQVAGAFGNSKTNSQGSAQTGNGIQGDPKSASTTGKYEGNGFGEFNLAGRSLSGNMPRPAYTVSEEGRIVVNITVDIKGNVIYAEIGKNTTIENGTLRKSALEAAKQTKFNSISSGDNQSGTITYKYSLK